MRAAVFHGPRHHPNAPHPLTGVKNPVILGHELSGEAMARGDFPLEGWVETIPFENLIEDGLERLHRQEGLNILVGVRSNRQAGASTAARNATGART